MKRSVSCPSMWPRRSGATSATAASISLMIIACAMGHAASFVARSSCDPLGRHVVGIRAEVEGGRRHRLAEQEALHLRASGGPQQLELLGGLHPLACGVELEH